MLLNWLAKWVLDSHSLPDDDGKMRHLEAVQDSSQQCGCAICARVDGMGWRVVRRASVVVAVLMTIAMLVLRGCHS